MSTPSGLRFGPQLPLSSGSFKLDDGVLYQVCFESSDLFPPPVAAFPVKSVGAFVARTMQGVHCFDSLRCADGDGTGVEAHLCYLRPVGIDLYCETVSDALNFHCVGGPDDIYCTCKRFLILFGLLDNPSCHSRIADSIPARKFLSGDFLVGRQEIGWHTASAIRGSVRFDAAPDLYGRTPHKAATYVALTAPRTRLSTGSRVKQPRGGHFCAGHIESLPLALPRLPPC
ncbi:Hypothetical predicted protein [Olea europaea subsp. europaea]|uniref:Uncharacterized protein n=1 Tax=Olea europaea subsp. europaea TaxID=158383 RepID=A0A8S0RBE3_OLEEU|nr:Hypothetical predicted protein [Olea europaea subsp. europaea]